MRTFLPVAPERVNTNPRRRPKCPMKPLPTPDTVDPVAGLRERVLWILDNRREWNARSLSLAAGQSEGYIRKLTEREPKRPDAAALEKIAELAKVSSDWLIFGRGAAELAAPVPRAPDARSPRLVLIETLAKSVVELANMGDMDGARASVEHLLKLVSTDAAAPSADGAATKPEGNGGKKTRAA